MKALKPKQAPAGAPIKESSFGVHEWTEYSAAALARHKVDCGQCRHARSVEEYCVEGYKRQEGKPK